MIVDAHCHIFTERIVANVNARPAMVRDLKLNTHDALPRLDPRALDESAAAHDIHLCVLLPTAGPERVRSENDRFIEFAVRSRRLRTLGTLHPAMRDLSGEASRILDYGINGFKFSSFSQRFDLRSREVERMLTEIELLGVDRNTRPVLVFDTFARADVHFAAPPDYLTTPSRLFRLTGRHPGINFVAAHMGGLLADFDELRRDLLPARNLYLDTANAAHTLEEDQFVELLRIHGAAHILFGTDWPWFVHASEPAKVRALLVKAGYDESQQSDVFGANAMRLFGL
ncbi:MAG: amidohydrolase family protein [Desulfomonilaceae bacterium]|nr:amidohydrolase family protein [Desulfomonilaceae bacterium]